MKKKINSLFLVITIPIGHHKIGTLHKGKKQMGSLKNKADYSKYQCPYSHLEKECVHQLHGPEGYENMYSVWCQCGFRGPVFYLEPKQLKLKKIKVSPVLKPTAEGVN